MRSWSPRSGPVRRQGSTKSGNGLRTTGMRTDRLPRKKRRSPDIGSNMTSRSPADREPPVRPFVGLSRTRPGADQRPRRRAAPGLCRDDGDAARPMVGPVEGIGQFAPRPDRRNRHTRQLQGRGRAPARICRQQYSDPPVDALRRVRAGTSNWPEGSRTVHHRCAGPYCPAGQRHADPATDARPAWPNPQ